MNTLTQNLIHAQTRVRNIETVLRDILNAFDDGPAFCVGIERSGRMVWKGSFIEYMERARDVLPAERDVTPVSK